MQLFSDILPFSWANFHFLRPAALWLLIPLVVIIVVLLLGNREQSKWKSIIAPALRPFMFSKNSGTAMLLPLIMLAIGGTFMILALAGPTWKKRNIPGEKIPAVTMVVLDLSRSMLCTDIQPSRLERAKLKISDFLDANPRVRVGLMAFAGTPHTVLPFTRDYKLVKHHSGSLYSWAMPVQGTNIPLMLTYLDTLMDRVLAPSTILLLTDVISDSEASLLADFADNSMHKLEILLFSTPNGAEIPKSGGVISKQSPATIANLQQNPKITVTSITLDKSDVEGIAKRISDHIIFQKDKKEDANEWDDMGLLFLIPSIIIAAFWFRRGWVVLWYCMLPLVTLTSCSVDSKQAKWWYTPDYQAQKHFEQGQYAQAADLFTDYPHKAMAYFEAGNYQAAAELYALDSTPAGMYNYALSLAKLGEYDDAVQSFEAAAQADSSLRDMVQKSITATQQLQKDALSVMRFNPQEQSLVDSALNKSGVKGKLKERKPQTEDEELSADTEVKKLPTKGDRLSDEAESNIHRAKEQKFPPKDFKMDKTPLETQILMQKTNADPGEFLHRRFEIQKQRYYPNVKAGKEDW